MNVVLKSDGQNLVPISESKWRHETAHHSQNVPAHLAFMTADHHRVRDFAVLELPRKNKPLSPQLIAFTLDLPLERVRVILDDLEAHLTFLFRNEAGDVAWAYPVTVEQTPHRLHFSSGEQIYGA